MITSTIVRAWHAELLRTDKPTPTRQARSLLRAVLTTAVTDELLLRNPCTLRGAGVSRNAERSVATLEQVRALADAVPPRHRMLVLVAAWSGARWGGLVALTRDSLDLDRGTIAIDRHDVELRDGSLVPLALSRLASDHEAQATGGSEPAGSPPAPGHVRALRARTGHTKIIARQASTPRRLPPPCAPCTSRRTCCRDSSSTAPVHDAALADAADAAAEL